MTGRIISEASVIALIEMKVNAANDKLTALEARIKSDNNPVSNMADRIAIIDLTARISAMNAVKGHIKFIEPYNPAPLGADENIGSITDTNPAKKRAE